MSSERGIKGAPHFHRMLPGQIKGTHLHTHTPPECVCLQNPDMASPMDSLKETHQNTLTEDSRTDIL